MILGVGLLPIIINISGVIWSDNQLAFSLTLAVSLILYHNNVKNNITKRVIYVFAILFIVYAGLSRNNALIAIVPIIILAVTRYVTKPIKIVLLTTLLTVSIVGINTILMSMFVDKRISSTAGPMADDIVQIHSEEELINAQLPNDLERSLINLRQCSSDQGIVIDSFRCGTAGDYETIIVKYPGEVKELWQEIISDYKSSYILRKILVFNYVLFPPEGRGYIWQDGIVDNSLNIEPKYPTVGELNRMYVFNFGYKHFQYLYEPWFWLFLGIGLFLYSKNLRIHRMYIRALSASAVLYIIGFIPTGVTADYRYIYWPVLACMISIILIIIEKNTYKGSTKKMRK